MPTFSISSNLLDRFPGTHVATLTVEDVHARQRTGKLDALVEAAVVEGHTIDDEIAARLEPWRAFFHKMHLNPDQTPPAHEALLRRIAEGKPFPRVNDLVDACNLTAIKHLLPVGAFDFRRLNPPITLRLAEKGESMIPIGTTKARFIQAGEAVYADRSIVFSRYTRDADATKITDSTSAVFIVLDLAHGQPVSLLEAAACSMEGLLNLLYGPSVDVAVAFHPDTM